MNDQQRRIARSALVRGLSVRELTAGLEGKMYAELVAKHMREIGANLPATTRVHEHLVLAEESEGVRQIRADACEQAARPEFWSTDAGDFLSWVSCHLNDALYPGSADDAGVFNLFQLITTILADRARIDSDFRRNVLAPPQSAAKTIPKPGGITRMLGIAINDYDAGRISRAHLLRIFQGAIDNGDILDEANELYVVANVIPLVDAGLLQPTEHLTAFESRMNRMAADFIAELRTQEGRRSKRARWWQFWR
jgi:hypothetical protein